jgi:acyl-Coa thioesterase superfamily protein/acyl-CoA thioesterase superfamily protein
VAIGDGQGRKSCRGRGAAGACLTILAVARGPVSADDALQTYGALFERDGERYVPTPLTRGPWDARAMHGGAPSALFAHVCETHDPGPACFVARITVELLRPVPLVPLTMHVRTLRPGRKVQWLEAALLDADEREVTRATVLRLRSDDVDTTGAVGIVADAPPPPDGGTQPLFPIAEGAVGYWTANELRMVRGDWTQPGPGIAWFRLRCPVVAGEDVSPCARVAAAADFGSGVGNPLRYTRATAINADVSISLHRHPITEWVCLESGAWVNPHGVGLVETRLHDERGTIGRSVQSLLVEPVSVRPGPMGAGEPID